MKLFSEDEIIQFVSGNVLDDASENETRAAFESWVEHMEVGGFETGVEVETVGNSVVPPVLKPTASLLVKLGSIARHADEMLNPSTRPRDVHGIAGAYETDSAVVKSLLGDPEVVAWFEAADQYALLPVKR